jgi:DNA-binding NarL/FixJ family response regulator
VKEAGKARLLVVDDHPIVRYGIAQLLDQEDGLDVAAQADSVDAAVRLLRETRFDLVITDIAMPGVSGLELIRRVQAMPAPPPVLVLSMHEESVYAERSLAAGARGYIMKQEAPETLVGAVHKLLAGGVHLSPTMEGRMATSLVKGRSDATAPSLSMLTEREFEVLQMIAQGLTSAQIAERINRSIKSVEAYRTSLRSKLGAKSTVDLARLALEYFPHVPRTAR